MNRQSVLLFVLLAAGSVQAAEKTFDRTFTVSPGGTLTVEADGAPIRVKGADTSQVTVHMRARGSEKNLDDMKLEATQSGDSVHVSMRRRDGRGWFSWGSGVHDEFIEVTVPKRYIVNVRTSGGNIDLADTSGTATLKTSGGNVTAKNVAGRTELRTSGGNILADTIRGDVDADTSGGSVRLLNVDGRIKGNSSGGSVKVSLVGANREISATTSGGSIEISLPRGTSGNVKATTSGGGISSDLPLSSVEQKEGRLQGELNGGGPPIYAHTSGGSITLRLEK